VQTPAVLVLATVTALACHGPVSSNTPAPATHADTSHGRYVRIRGHTGPPTGQGAIAYEIDTVLLCPRLDSAGVAWPPSDLPKLDPALIDTTAVLRGPAIASYTQRCPMPLDAVVRITTKPQSRPESP